MTSYPVKRDTGVSYPVFTADNQKTRRNNKMTKNKKFENLEITTFGYEGDDKYFKTFSEKLAQELKEGNEYFEYGGYIYEICCLCEGIDVTLYEICKYDKSDCIDTGNGALIIHSPSRMFCGNLVANVWRCKND